MLVKAAAVKTQACRVLSRPRTFFSSVVVILMLCLLGLMHHNDRLKQRALFMSREPLGRDHIERRAEELKQKRILFEKEYHALKDQPGYNAIYGNTLETLVDEDVRRPSHEERLGSASNTTRVNFTTAEPVTFNPYPKYNSREWKAHHEAYVPCLGPTGKVTEDIRVFKGRPRNFPKPAFGSYNVLGLDRNLCFERETRLGQYGVLPVLDENGNEINWDEVNWGELQDQCLEKNQARFARNGPKNEYVDTNESSAESKRSSPSDDKSTADQEHVLHTLRRFWRKPASRKAPERRSGQPADGTKQRSKERSKLEPRTALLLRSFSGKTYTDNDKQVIRSLITELNLRTGGEYHVFLFVHIKDADQDIWTDDAYKAALEQHVPAEFRSMAVLWNERAVDRMYPNLTAKARQVHHGQFLPVQMFMQEFREFDFVWNWEMDSRVVGHNYDVLTRLSEFGKKQPRRGLWERNERFYIPSFHGSYDSQFRSAVERAVGGETIWGAPKVPVVTPLGPKPPVPKAEDDDYKWGVGEEADLIELAPIFDPVNSNWVMRNTVWGYRSLDFPWGRLPRRTTIITQSRLSRRLLDAMHYEDLRGNHVASEMVAQTTALLHGFKAVYAPMPVFFDRAWSGEQLERWFNGGPRGQSGSFGSSFGWGQEGRYMGSTWYFRANPPQRLYNNWMGYEDTAIGGPEWEAEHGRPCLPTMILHPVKEIKPTEKGFATDVRLAYD
ncbi:hypothetical protein MYCTH_2300488 [Thermothelomyces thermophilus ATCC 42464]|uniref:Uncharacterized protein n=1 Tax=Thermothelomyces thermophilus (strain ATCC 42464 / BCRC 31852 / DSM 1799) TaxID=573729 RepID=G2Q7C7_THET4|nr:uncharacterized protein MYCTH_2300488 [Thermothelomyces thermophilus ATCC 42464]AEO56038.1 hypothetical protein MYCTH_2300488 [Thermothelomyces thermophilus ATCC 42464]